MNFRMLAAERSAKQNTAEEPTNAAKAVERSTQVAMTICKMQHTEIDFKQQRQECSLMRGLYGNVRRSEMQFDSKSIKKNVF